VEEGHAMFQHAEPGQICPCEPAILTFFHELDNIATATGTQPDMQFGVQYVGGSDCELNAGRQF
jgi:hypothetical protein